MPNIQPAQTGNYNLFFNGKKVSEQQLSKFLQQNKLNLLKNYNWDLDKYSFLMSFDNEGLIQPGLSDNIIEVYKNNIKIFHGYMVDIVENYSTKFYTLTGIPMLNLLSKDISVYSDTGYTNAGTRLNQAISDLLNKFPQYLYTLNPISSGIAGVLQGINIKCNTNGTSINSFDYVKKLLEMLDIGIYFNNLEINLYAMPTVFPVNAKAIKPIMTKLPNLSCITDFFYDKSVLTCKPDVNGSDITATYGSGNATYTQSYSDVYMTQSSLQNLAIRKNNILSKDYRETDSIDITKQDNIDLGEFFSFGKYSFVTVSKEERLNSYVIKGIGIKIS